MDSIKTRILILSDTHAASLPAEARPRVAADVAIHCGDLTEGSKLDEFRTALDLLKSLDAPLKLVIAGNHDWTLDLPTFRQKVREAGLESEPALVTQAYGEYGEVRQLFDEARGTHGIHLLDEGTHRFVLANGAALVVYASPFTPSPEADWGFQYRLGEGHDFAIRENDDGGGDDADIAITHGPPEGVLDRTAAQQRLGCPHLFAAVARARPRLHCFGHVHAGWGAKLVAWRGDKREDSNPSATPLTHFTAIDNGRSTVIDTLASFTRGKFDDDDTAAEKSKQLACFQGRGCRPTRHGPDSPLPVEQGKQTLFVNAAILGDEDMPFHLPWLVELNLAQNKS